MTSIQNHSIDAAAPRLPADTHTHTFLCRHAGGTPLEYARAAAERGIPEIACTDHIPFPNDPQPAIRMMDGEFRHYLELVAEAQQQAPCPVLLGMEADFQEDLINGHLQALLDQAEFDVVLGSLHTGPFWDLRPDEPAATPEFVERMWWTYFRRMTALAQSRLYDVCSHFDMVKRNGCRTSEAVMAEIIPPALDAVAAAGMAIEINTSGLGHGAAETYPSAQILAWMFERQIPITFGSDAHEPAQVGRHFEQAVEMAKAAGYTTRAAFRKRRLSFVPL